MSAVRDWEREIPWEGVPLNRSISTAGSALLSRVAAAAPVHPSSQHFSPPKAREKHADYSIPDDVESSTLLGPPDIGVPYAWNKFFTTKDTTTTFRQSLMRNRPHNSANQDGGSTCIRNLRKQFSQFDTDGSGDISETEVLAQVQASLQARSDTLLLQDHMLLLKETVRRRFAQIDLNQNGTIEIDEWIHFMMLHMSAPSQVAAQHLNREVCKVMRESNQFLLTRIQNAFEQADVHGNGLITKEQWHAAFKHARLNQSPVGDLDNVGILTYFEFVWHALGVTLVPVQLALYDLSSGFAQYMPAMLVGHSYEAVWHAGVRVFGKEFWYGGGIFANEDYKVPERFGKPVKIIELGKTMRSEAELSEFIRYDLLPSYNRANYHVLHHNCVCFANEVVQFLLHGKTIPEEVRKQPKWVESSVLYPVIMPLLTKLFDGLEAGASFHRQVDDMTDEWRQRVQTGDLVLHRERFVDLPQVVLLEDVITASEGHGTADFFSFQCASLAAADDGATDAWAWTLVKRRGVPVLELYPCFHDVFAARTVLQVGAVGTDTSVRAVLQRTMVKACAPVCEQGHILETIPLSWMSSAHPCSICRADCASAAADRKAERMCCQKCSFDVCGDCLAIGRNMDGGGVFSDILTPTLASALRDHLGWLNWKSKRYFIMADEHSRGVIDEGSMWCAIARLKAELGLGSAQFDKDLEEFLRNQRRHQRHFKDGISAEFFKLLFNHILAAADCGAVPFESNTLIGL